MRVLVTGGAGQVGLELARQAWPTGAEIRFPTRAELDLASPDAIAAYFCGERWDCVINCAAWTAVDAAEDHVADAFLANAQGPAWLAEAAARSGTPIIHVSTDYVFDGSADRPYREDDPVGPVGAYGASKLAGELAVRAANPRAVVLRTAWVLSAHRANFLKTMLRLGAERDRLTVVGDQVGCPTTAADIAFALRMIAVRLIEDAQAPVGIYHFVGAGQASWCELAQAIFDLAAPLGGPSPVVAAITSAEFPTRARRPVNSRLDTSKIARDFGIVPPLWQSGVKDIIAELLSAPIDGKV
ncbi:MAG: dTDP-4-dehydrorhamnose reductase [Sphingomonadales bacterium]|nr:dTDP-4-dehydrorhamnose reductase [Sphingomonadales bacterium]